MLLQAQAEADGRPGLDPVELNRLAGNRQPNGYAIEVRVYAENPGDDHKPAPGLFTDVTFPEGNGIRVDTWLERGSWVTPFFGKSPCSLKPRRPVTYSSFRPAPGKSDDIFGGLPRGGACADGDDAG